MTKPKVSVIMPTYNQVNFLGAALAALECQEFKDFELIIVNDGSDDGTNEMLDDLDVLLHLDNENLHHPWKVLRQENAGAAQAINAGIAVARGDWWTWVSSDNEQYPSWLARLMEEAARGVGAVFSAYDRDRAGNKVALPFDPSTYRVGCLIDSLNCFYGPSFVIRKEVWRAAGPHTGRISHDYGHWLRVEEACMVTGHSIRYVDESLCLYNAHPARATVVLREQFDAHEHQRQAIARRKQGTGICLREVTP